MLKGLTSLWDYFNKCKEDKAYEEVAIRGYIHDTCNQSPHNFETAKNWLEKWVLDSVKNGFEETCNGMVNYLNQQIKQINNDEFEARRQGQTIQEAIDTQRQQAQMTGQPVITAQQTPLAHTDWITSPFTVRYTIDNQGAHIENLWGDIPGLPGHPDNPIVGPPLTRTRAPHTGEMTEYGWYDQEVENEIETVCHQQNVGRDDAIIRVFNECDFRPHALPAADDGEVEGWNYTEDDPMEER